MTPPASNPPAPHVRWPIRARIAIAACGTAVIATAVLTALAYAAEREAYLRGVDARLTAAAQAVPLILPGDYHGRVFAGQTIPHEEYIRVVKSLTDYCDRSGLPYVYTYIVRDGEVYLTAAPPSPELRANGEVFEFLMHEYDPPPGVIEAAADGRSRFTEYTTRFGSFRSLFVPVGDSPDTRYVVGADVMLGDLHQWLTRRLWRYIAAGLGMALIVGALGVFVGRRLARPITELTRVVDELGVAHPTITLIRPRGAGDASPALARASTTAITSTPTPDAFDSPDADAVLQRLAESGIDESALLAASMLAMRRRLRTYVTELRDVTAAKQRIETQIQIARQIQQALIPRTPPAVPGFDILGWSHAAEQVGGDFFDWLLAADGRNGDSRAIVMLADVTGHGVGPALMASICRAHARATLRDDRPLRDGLTELNRLLIGDLTDGRFVTFFAARIDPVARRVTVASAGHGPILLYRAADRSVSRLPSTGVPLGVLDDPKYEPDHELTMQSGDALLVVSDGVIEWPNRRGEQFGITRLVESFGAAAGEGARSGGDAAATADCVLRGVCGRIDAFAEGAVQTDDTTAVVVRCV